MTKKAFVAVVRVFTIYTLLSAIAIFNYRYEWVNIPYYDISDCFFILATYYNPLLVIICGLLLTRLGASERERKFGRILVVISPFWVVLLLHMMSGEY